MVLYRIFLTVLLSLFIIECDSQQRANKYYTPEVNNPVYQKNTGPVIYIDEAHHNFHTLDGRFKAFAKLLIEDGYILKPLKKEISEKILEKTDILVISNAQNNKNIQNWYKPVYSAFTDDEVIELNKWVNSGGSLFLIADHMPMPGAVKNIAASFGITFYDGFALNINDNTPDMFYRKNGTLSDNIITNGRNSEEKIDSVQSFTGQAFEIPEEASPILVFSSEYIQFIPDTAWVFTESTAKMSIEGFIQGAFIKYGKGKLVVFGEAAMFTSQIVGSGDETMSFGMGSDRAKQNPQLLLNIIHWLDGLFD